METLKVKYLITVVIFDNLKKNEFSLKKDFETTIESGNGALYDNYHVISKRYILEYFTEEIREYTNRTGVESDITGDSNLIVNEFEIFSKTDGIEIFFENEENPEEFTLFPTIKAYVPSVNTTIDKPILKGNLIDDITIKWSWIGDNNAHYIVDGYKNIIAQIPIGVNSYIETDLEYDTEYTRMLVSYNSKATSEYSDRITILTSKDKTNKGGLVNYEESRNTGYDEENIITEPDKLSAFRSGIGHGNDCLLVKSSSDGIDVSSTLEFNLHGTGKETINFYPKVSFGYRHKFTCNWNERVRKGSLKFSTKGYPIQSAKVRMYRYAVKEIDISYKITGRCTYLYKSGTAWKSSTTMYTVNGTYKLAADSTKVKYTDKGYARMVPINETIGTKTIGDLLKEKAAENADINTAKTVEWHDIRIYDNYSADKNESWRDTESVSNDGTFRICANTNGAIGLGNTLKAIGHADAQLYTYESIKEAEFNSSDSGDYVIFPESEYKKSLVCVNDSTSVYTGTDIVTKIEALSKGDDVVIKDNGTSTSISIGKTLSSGPISVNFTNEDHNKVYIYKDLFTGTFPSNNLQKYKFVTTITETTDNIVFKSNTKLTKDLVITEVASINDSLQFEAQSYEEVRSYTEHFPPVGEDPLHGIVNGRDDEFVRKHFGRDDFIIKAHTFPMDNSYYNAKFELSIEGITPSGARVDHTMTSSGGKTSTINSDVITFTSSYLSTKKLPIDGVISSKLVDVKLENEYDKLINTELQIDKNTSSLYDTFELNVKSRNSEVMVVNSTKNIISTNGKVPVFAIVKALKHPSSKWSPSIHNGYYYLNQHENYIYSNGKPISKSIVEAEVIGYGSVSFNVIITTKNGNKLTKGYSFKIKFDKKEYKIVNDINELIAPWLESIGIGKDDIKNMEIVQLDNETNMEYESEEMSSDNSPNLADIFNTWERFSHGSSSYDNEKFAWNWNESSKKIECNINSNNYIGFISDVKLDKYRARVRFSSRCPWDNDTIGFVLAYHRTEDGTEHSLSAVRDLNNNGQQWKVIYNYRLNGSYIVDNKSSVLNPVSTTIWSEYLPEGSYVEVERNKNIIKVSCSNMGQTTMAEGSMIEIDLNTPKLSILNQPCSYGFSCQSQEFSSFDDITIVDYRNVVGGIIASSKEVSIIKIPTEVTNVVTNTLELSPLPQQFSPIIVESEEYGLLEHVENLTGNSNKEYIEEEFIVESKDKIFMLTYFNIDKSSLYITINYSETRAYTLKNNAVLFNNYLNVGDVVRVKYKVKNSFNVDYDIANDKTIIKFNTPGPVGMSTISYETSIDSNLTQLNHLSLNPIHNTDYSGFFYITDEVNEPKYIKLHVSVNSMFISSRDRTRIYVEVLDDNLNPVENEEVFIQCTAGTLNIDDTITDINGVVSATYYSPDTVGTVKITATCNEISSSKTIKIKERVM